MDLRGQAAVVTAGAAGLGLHIARAMAAQGAHVVIGDVDARAGRAAVTEIESEGGSATFVASDVTEDGELLGLIDAAAQRAPLRALVNNAGGWSLGGLQYPEASRRTWSRTLDLNLRAPMLATQLCLDLMEQHGGGAVVSIGSTGGLGPHAYGSPEYGAAKAGLIRFTSSVQGLAASRGIRISCVVPDWVGLPRALQEFEQLSPEEQAKSEGLVEPDLVANEVVRLVEDEASAGRVVAIRPGRTPYLLDPAGIDPQWR